ncbi:MAG: hypothetical protein U0L08_07220 [Bacteroidales bacterium]|nr:hypothetical protein [Bacteroidales bacterium]
MDSKTRKIKIGLVDADLLCNGTRHPNLVLMKLAGFLNDNGIDFKLIIDQDEDIASYKFIYISRVFTFTKMPDFYDKATPEQKGKFRKGGTGFYANELNINKYRYQREKDMNQLENDRFLLQYPNHRGGSRTHGIDLARQMPYYHLYDEFVDKKESEGYKREKYKDYQQYSIGFLTRGCIRHCPFCINKLEDRISPYSDLEWFLDDERDEHGRLVRPYIYLWDDNFLAADPTVWRARLQQLIDTDRPFQFRQGLDERMLAQSPHGEEMAEMLSKTKYHGDFIFAFDNWKDRPLIERALKIWKHYNPKKGTKFYLFCGFKQTEQGYQKFYRDIWEIFQRIKVLMTYGCVGYLMRHEDYHSAPISNLYIQIARWCNQQAFYKKMSFWEYTYRNQTFWEQGAGFEVLQPIKTFEEFQRDYETGYYDKEDSRGKVRKICKTLQTLLDTLEMFPEHRKELLEMFNYKMSNLKNPKLWENPK